MLDRIIGFVRRWARNSASRGAGYGTPARLKVPAHFEQMLHSIVDTVIDGIITIDDKGIIATFNPAAERIFGYLGHEVIGRNVSILMSGLDRGRHDEYIANYLRTGHAKIIGIGREVTAQRKDGSLFPAELGVSEFRLGRARFFTGIVRDITERKKLEQELYRRMRQLAEADQRKDQFIGLLSHELRNPLAPVRNGLQILRHADAQDVHRVVTMMDRQVAHMTRLIDDLLDVSRLTSGKIELRREDVPLHKVLQQAAETVAAEIALKGQRLVVENADETIVLYVDPVRIAQVVSNLLHNAMKFSETGGDIHLRVAREDDTAVIRVKDTGIGIARDKLESIFEVFVQIDASIERRRSGLGLGLTLAKNLVELHGGTVRASSAGPGCGSEFEVRLPVITVKSDTFVQHESISGGFSQRRLLIIDDNMDSADSLSVLLRMMSHDVMTLYSGRGAVEQAIRFRPDVVLCDIAMPDVSGLDVARQLKANVATSRMMLVAITGYGRPEDIVLARRSGFDAHLVKPVDLNKISALLTSAPRLGA